MLVDVNFTCTLQNIKMNSFTVLAALLITILTVEAGILDILHKSHGFNIGGISSKGSKDHGNKGKGKFDFDVGKHGNVGKHDKQFDFHKLGLDKLFGGHGSKNVHIDIPKVHKSQDNKKKDVHKKKSAPKSHNPYNK